MMPPRVPWIFHKDCFGHSDQESPLDCFGSWLVCQLPQGQQIPHAPFDLLWLCSILLDKDFGCFQLLHGLPKWFTYSLFCSCSSLATPSWRKRKFYGPSSLKPSCTTYGLSATTTLLRTKRQSSPFSLNILFIHLSWCKFTLFFCDFNLTTFTNLHGYLNPFVISYYQWNSDWMFLIKK